MDPQKNVSNPASNANSQVPLSAQDDGPQTNAPQPAQESQEVMVDFSQGQETAPSGSSQPGGLSNMPSITPEAVSGAPATATPTGNNFGQPADPLAQPGPAAVSGAPTQPLVPQDPYANAPAAQPVQPGVGQPQPGTQPGAGYPTGPAAGPQTGFGAPGPQPAQTAGQPSGPMNPIGGFDQQQSTVPPTVPVGGAKGDKKTIFILAGVAVLLIAAILVLVVL